MYYTLSVEFYGCKRSCYLTKDDEFREYSRSDGSDEAQFANKTELKKKIKELIDEDWRFVSVEKMYNNGASGWMTIISAVYWRKI
jgi:hypothetical protein